MRLYEAIRLYNLICESNRLIRREKKQLGDDEQSDDIHGVGSRLVHFMIALFTPATEVKDGNDQMRRNLNDGWKELREAA